jgi:hypothetical protein
MLFTAVYIEHTITAEVFSRLCHVCQMGTGLGHYGPSAILDCREELWISAGNMLLLNQLFGKMHTFVGTFIEYNYLQKICFLLFSKITWFQKVMYKLYNSFVLKGHFCVTLKCLNQYEIMSGVDFFKNINKDLIVS